MINWEPGARIRIFQWLILEISNILREQSACGETRTFLHKGCPEGRRHRLSPLTHSLVRMNRKWEWDRTSLQCPNWLLSGTREEKNRCKEGHAKWFKVHSQSDWRQDNVVELFGGSLARYWKETKEIGDCRDVFWEHTRNAGEWATATDWKCPRGTVWRQDKVVQWFWRQFGEGLDGDRGGGRQKRSQLTAYTPNDSINRQQLAKTQGWSLLLKCRKCKKNSVFF